jgi:hypothetical protein
VTPTRLRVVAALLCVATPVAAATAHEHQFHVAETAEVVATITIDCARCDWEVQAREAVVFTVNVDGRYVQHVPAVRTGRAEYPLLLGRLAAGPHRVSVVEDSAWTPAALRDGAATVERVQIEQLPPSSPEFRGVSHAPFVYARADTVGRFTDVPVLMYYEIEPTAAGERYRYSVVFTNEDGGTATDALMARWGRTVDIEDIYSVEVNRDGEVLREAMLGPKHQILPFHGRHEARHALLWVSTDNNMVRDTGTASVRYAPVPLPVILQGVSRESVVDARPWIYRVAAKELVREGKIVPEARAGTGRISDPRRHVYVDGCGDVGTSALTFAIQIGDGWLPSDRGVREFRIARDTYLPETARRCFRAAIPLPPGLRGDVVAVRAQAFTRAGDNPPKPSEVTLTRVNRVFTLDENYVPQPSVLSWSGALTLVPDGPPVLVVSR